MEVIFTLTLVSIYHGGQCVATHVRSLSPNGYTWVKEHLPSQSQAYYEHGAQRFIDRAGAHGKAAETVMRELFAHTDKPAELFCRSAQGILAMARETEPDIFNLACELAVRFGKCNYPFIHNMVKSRCAGYISQQAGHTQSPHAPSPHENIRGRLAFN